MEVEQSNVVGCRKRTESNGGSSDSDLSEGWNIVDHFDANGPEAPSSDGESVEVIEAEEESSLQDADSDKEVDVPVTETDELVSQTALMSMDVLPVVALPPAREEMFDSSFSRFLLTASLALLFSHLALLVAENVLAWNSNLSSDSTSFLKDLPITPKPLSQSNLAEKVSWDSDEDLIVDSVDYTKEYQKTIIDKSSTPVNDKIEETKNTYVKEKLALKRDSQDLGGYIKELSDMSISIEAQNKFAQAILILDALHLGIDDLEKVEPKNPDLNLLLKNQKNKLIDILTEVKFGVSRSMERLAINILNKVQTLEKRFENQWGKLEKNGYRNEPKGFSYDWDESSRVDERNIRSDRKHLDKFKKIIEVDKKKLRKIKNKVDNYKYEADKDSAGKLYNKENNGNGRSNEYYKLIKDEKINKRKHKLEENLLENENRKENHSKHSGKEIKEKHYLENENHSVDSKDNHNKRPVIKKSVEEVLARLFEERCKKILENHNSSNNLKEYHKLKEKVDKKLKIPKKLFDQLYLTFCVQNSGGAKEDSKHKKEYLKRYYKDNMYKKRNIFRNNQLEIEDSVEKNSKMKIIESSYVNIKEEGKSDHSNNRVIEPVSQQEWTTAYEIPPSTNKTDVDGYWFFKAGESRSHVRWFHQRSDWWFDRASQRRHNQYNYPHPPSWYVGRSKNWFFRRAWARQQCRVSPQNSWCQLDDETVTVPNSNFK